MGEIPSDQLLNESNAYSSARGSWTFNGRIVDIFEQHAQRSIPLLTEIRALASAFVHAHFERTTPFIRDDAYCIVDVGCSRGAMLHSLIAHRPVLDDNTATFRSARADLLLKRSIVYGSRDVQFGPRVAANTRIDGYATEAQARAAAEEGAVAPGVVRVDYREFQQIIERSKARPQMLPVSFDYFGIDNSAAMIDRARSDAEHLNASRWNYAFECIDVERDFDRVATTMRPHCVMFVLSLMFMHHDAHDVYAARLQLLKDVHESMADRSMIVVVDKVRVDNATTNIYHDFKRHRGYTEREIAAKASSIDGVLVSLTEHSNMKLLNDAGFTAIASFFRWGPFAGWIAYKENRT